MQEVSLNKVMGKKREAKKELAKKLGFSRRKALVAVFLDKDLSTAEMEKFKSILEAAEAVGTQMVILADENSGFAKYKNVKFLEYGRSSRNDLLFASDMALCFEFNDVEELLMHGIIPVSYKGMKTQNYDPNQETGNSFIYNENNHWAIFAALVRAMETFRFPYDWKNIVREGLKSVKSSG